MKFRYTTNVGGSYEVEADSLTFEGGGLQFWRHVERVQAPPRRDLIFAFAPGAWVRVETLDA